MQDRNCQFSAIALTRVTEGIARKPISENRLVGWPAYPSAFYSQALSRNVTTLPAIARPSTMARTCSPQASRAARFSEAKSWR
jgi:hypothetical protein